VEAEENHASGGVDDDGAGGEVVGETLAAGTVRVSFEVGEEVVAQRELGGVCGVVGGEEAQGVCVVLRGSCASGMLDVSQGRIAGEGAWTLTLALSLGERGSERRLAVA
jgi:hypothetical protein